MSNIEIASGLIPFLHELADKGYKINMHCQQNKIVVSLKKRFRKKIIFQEPTLFLMKAKLNRMINPNRVIA